MNQITRQARASGALANRHKARTRPPATSATVPTTEKIAVLPTAFQNTGSAVSTSAKFLRPMKLVRFCGPTKWTLL